MNLPRALLLAAFSLTLQAADYEVTWSNGAVTAKAIIGIDTANLPNPGSYNSSGAMPAWITSLSMTVTGASNPAQNRTFGLADYSGAYWSASYPLNMGQELKGQSYYAPGNYYPYPGYYPGMYPGYYPGMYPGMGTSYVWGSGASNGMYMYGSQTSGGFYLFAANPSAPTYDSMSGMMSYYNNTYAMLVEGQSLALQSFKPYVPTTIVAAISAGDSRVSGGGVLDFQGGSFTPIGVGVCSLTNQINVIAASTGTLDASTQDIASTGLVTIAGTGLTLTGSTTSTISLAGDISGAGILVNASGNNVISGANTCAGIAVTGGSLRVNSAASLTSVINSVSGGGTMILPTNIAFIGTVTIAGTGAGGQPGALVLDATTASAAGGSSLNVALTGDATIALRGGQNCALTGGIAGATPGQNLTLNVVDHTLTLAGTTASSVAQVTKDGAGVLLVGATGVINSGSVVVSDGLLTNNGAINGVVSVTANGTLGGSGTISGAVTINGTLAPGNSPGLQTQVAGDTTQATGSHFVAQLGGTTPGNGDGFHDQYYVQAGRFILDPAVTLDVRSWVQADGVTTFVPARRDIFAVIRASNGIVGQFSDLTNADYAQWVIYENNTNPADQYGYLYGTGLNGDQTFAAYGSTPARAAIGASLWAAAITPAASSTQAHPGAFLDGSTTLGQVAIGLLTAVDADAYLAALSPEPYLAVGDYALTVSRSLTDAAFAQSSLIKTGAWTVGAGYNRAQHGYVGAGSPGYQLSGDTGLVTVAYDFGPHCSVGFFYGQNHGKTVAANAHVDYRGGIFGLTSVGRIPGAYPVTLKGAVVASELRFDATRVGPTDAGSAVSHHPLRSLGGQFTAAVELHKDGRLTVSPTLGFVQGRSTTAAFAEAGAGANLSVDAMAQDSSRLVAGLGLTYLASTDLVFDLSAAYEHEFASDAGVVSASFLDAAQTVPMTMDRAIADRDSTTFGVGASWKLDNSTTVRLGAEVRGNRELTKDYRYNASVNVRF